MSADDQRLWDERYTNAGVRSEWSIPGGLVEFKDVLPVAGRALDVACGAGHGSVWLAARGLSVVGVDVSSVAVDQASQLAVEAGLGDRCQFQVHDLDLGLPDGPPVDLVVCHRFNAPDLDDAMLERLVPGGLLALTVLSEVGADAGPFRIAAGDLLARFANAHVLGHREGEGQATIVVQAAGPQPYARLD